MKSNALTTWPLLHVEFNRKYNIFVTTLFIPSGGHFDVIQCLVANQLKVIMDGTI